jgi:hypothetical protein
LLYSRDLNLWGPGPPKHVPSKPWKVRSEANQDEWEVADEPLEKLRDPTGKNAVNPELLLHIGEGMRRSEAYFDVYCTNGDRTDTKRTEDVVVPLAKIDGDGKKGITETQEKGDRWVSVDATLLSKRQIFKSTELTAELKLLKTKLLALNLPVVVAGKNSNGTKTQASSKPVSV